MCELEASPLMSIDNTIFWSAVFVGILSIVAVKLSEWLVGLAEKKNRKKDEKHSDA
jgi:hypothetical protein